MSCREREVTFFSDGNRLAGVLFEPGAQPRPGPGLVLVQGLGGIGRNYRFPQTARAFAAAGYTCLIFDYRGFGESEGQAHRLWPEEQFDDLHNALTFLACQPSVDPQRLGVWGTSFGGAHVVRASAVDERVRCAVSIVGIGDGERWLRSVWRYYEWHELLRRIAADRQQRVTEGVSGVIERFEITPLDPDTATARERPEELSPELPKVYPPLRLTLESVEKMIAYRPEEALGRGHGCPLLVVHAVDDLLVPLAEAEAVYARAPEPKRLVLLPGGHFAVYRSPLFEEATALSLAWLAKHLPVPGAASA